jgi:hypothetical protein
MNKVQFRQLITGVTSQFTTKPTVEEAALPTQSNRPTVRHTFQIHEGGIRSFVFLHDNVHIVSGSRDGTMRKRGAMEMGGQTHRITNTFTGRKDDSVREGGRKCRELEHGQTDE